jgi:hypothetical protein
MVRRLAAALALVLVPPAVALTRAQPEQLFPIARGDRWTLREPGSGLPRTVSIRQGVSGLELFGFPGLTDGTRLRRADTDVRVWEPYRQRWVTLLRFGPRGTRYTVDLRGAPVWNVEARVLSTTAVIRDYRGRVHRGCTRFAFRYHGLADAGLTELTFAPGVGLVRVSQTSFAGPRTSVLVSARIR